MEWMDLPRQPGSACEDVCISAFSNRADAFLAGKYCVQSGTLAQTKYHHCPIQRGLGLASDMQIAIESKTR